MFATGILNGSGVNVTDPSQERDPPPPATPVTFPTHTASPRVDWSDCTVRPSLQDLFAKITKPANLKDEHVFALNIIASHARSVDEMIPVAPNGTPCLANGDAMTTSHDRTYADAAKTSSKVSPTRKNYEDRLAELSVDNDLAFRTLSKKLPYGVEAPRLAYLRKFWEGLDCMSQYWDCSLDEFFERPETSLSDKSSADLQHSERSGQHEETNQLHSSPLPGGTTVIRTDSGLAESGPEEASSRSLLRRRYRGRRTSTGREMPESFRVNTVRAFVEGAIWPFQCTFSPPRQMPILQFSKLNVPLRQTGAVYRVPVDRVKARRGWITGPVLGVQIRAETEFADSGGKPDAIKCRLDYVREIGCLLRLAQERRREGRKEVKPGEGKWWTTTPRWGGGARDEFGQIEDQENSDYIAMSEEYLDGKQHRHEYSRKKKSAMMIWKELKCGSSNWDPKTDYEAVGRDRSSPYDEVFLVSSLNHHISILKLKVHYAYMDFITFGKAPACPPTETDWCTPILQRTKWFDLFDLQERVEAFQALWAVMVFLTHDPSTRSELPHAKPG